MKSCVLFNHNSQAQLRSSNDRISSKMISTIGTENQNHEGLNHKHGEKADLLQKSLIPALLPPY
jgi:hypothetical protein